MMRMKLILTLIVSLVCFKSHAFNFLFDNLDEPSVSVDDVGFKALFKEDSVLNFSHVEISDGKKRIYFLRAPNGSVRIEKLSETKFSFYLTDKVLIDSNWIQRDFLKHDLIYSETTSAFVRDYLFSNFPRFSEAQIQQCIDDRNAMIKESTYTTKDWDEISETRYKKVMQLCVNLFIATINGDGICKSYLLSVRKDFDIVNAGELSEICIAYEQIVAMM